MFAKAQKLQRSGVVAVADIDGESVGVALVSMSPKKPAHVIIADRTALSLEDRAFGAAVAQIASQITAVGGRVQKAYVAKHANTIQPISEIYIVLHAPWARSRVSKVAVTFPEEIVITESVIADVAKRILRSEKDVSPENLFEASVVRTELNGYPCGSPTRKRATQLTLSAIISECEYSTRTTLEGAVRGILPHATPVYRSSSRVATSVIHRLVGATDYFAMHVADDATTFTIVRDGVVTQTLNVAEGTRSILKRVSGKNMPEATLTLMRMLAREQCSDPACETIRDAMGKAEPELVRAFGEAMNKCVAERRIPNRLILMAHPDLIGWLAKFFARIDFTQFTLTTQPFEVQPFLPKDTDTLVRSAEGVSLDVSLALSCALVNIEALKE